MKEKLTLVVPSLDNFPCTQFSNLFYFQPNATSTCVGLKSCSVSNNTPVDECWIDCQCTGYSCDIFAIIKDIDKFLTRAKICELGVVSTD